ncbi:MAG TPA: alkaline phosphatase family protein [Candidatus Acidoferrales bacterium]|nr:alkaline phosphatase family protein [Candidatus Acidoferrales bacterium]
MLLRHVRILAVSMVATLAACSSGSSGASLPATAPQSDARPHSSSPIQHVVIVIQENRSFDNLFAGFPNADSSTSGKNHLGKTIALSRQTLVGRDLDISHNHSDFVRDYDGGKMDGFDLAQLGLGRLNERAGAYAYQYVDRAEIAPYWALAKQYVLDDHMFQTQSSSSFTAHQDLIAGGTEINATESVIDLPSRSPWGCDSPPGTTTVLISATKYPIVPGPFPCFTYGTIRDSLDAKGISWKYYTPTVDYSKGGGIWSAFDAIKAVRNDGREWSNNVSSPNTNVFTDIAAGNLPAVAWVVPDYENSDHPGVGSKDTGPSWVASIVNAVGKSQYWNSTAIVILWDDWGGFYDNVKPVSLDYNGLGFRVPCIVVSPYARKGYVDHTQYEFGSILKFVEDNWGLGALPNQRASAVSIAPAFDLTAKPRPFKPVTAEYSQSFFMHQAPSDLPVDDE